MRYSFIENPTRLDAASLAASPPMGSTSPPNISAGVPGQSLAAVLGGRLVTVGHWRFLPEYRQLSICRQRFRFWSFIERPNVGVPTHVPAAADANVHNRE